MPIIGCYKPLETPQSTGDIINHIKDVLSRERLLQVKARKMRHAVMRCDGIWSNKYHGHHRFRGVDVKLSRRDDDKLKLIYEQYADQDVVLHVYANPIGIFGYECATMKDGVGSHRMNCTTGVLRIPGSVPSWQEALYIALFYAARHVVSAADKQLKRGVFYYYMMRRRKHAAHRLKVAFVISDRSAFEALTGRRVVSAREAVLIRRVLTAYVNEPPENITYVLAPLEEMRLAMWWWPWEYDDIYDLMPQDEVKKMLRQYASRTENFHYARGCLRGNEAWEL